MPSGDASLRRPSDSAVSAKLSRDYAEVAGLMAQFDKQVGSFVDDMSKLNGSAPEQAGLAALWDEQAKSIRSELRAQIDPTTLQAKKPKGKQSGTTTTRHARGQDDDASDAEEGADDKNDPLVFI